MSWKSLYKQRLTLLTFVWVCFTSSLVSWWWYFGWKNASSPNVSRMLLWEGGILTSLMLVGGLFFLRLTYRNQQQQERLRLFFATFAHDLKTSITRLRLQSEIMEESVKTAAQQELLENIRRLDLQLENSLWLANLEDQKLLLETISLSELLSSIRAEFPNLEMDLNRDAMLKVDRRAFQVVLRNVFSNSLLHGKASQIHIRTERSGDLMKIYFSDNGQHSDAAGDVSALLQQTRPSSQGIGLYLTKQVLLRMQGNLYLRREQGFTSEVEIPWGDQ